MLDCISAVHSDIEKTNQYILSIQVSLDGFSFLVTDPVENRIIAYQNSPVKIGNEKLISRHLNEWISDQHFLKNTFKKVNVFIYSDVFSLVPNAILTENKTQEIGSFFLQNKNDAHTEIINIPSLEATLFFPVQTDILQVLNRHLNFIELNHPLNQLLRNTEESSKLFEACLITSKNNICLIINRKSKELILAGNFSVNHPNDIVYNVLNTFQQLGISRSQTAMRVAEVIQPNFQPEKLLNPYFSDLAMLNSPSQYKNVEINPLHLYLATN